MSCFLDRDIPREPAIIELFKKLVSSVHFRRTMVHAAHAMPIGGVCSKFTQLRQRRAPELSLQVARKLEEEGDV